MVSTGDLAPTSSKDIPLIPLSEATPLTNSQVSPSSTQTSEETTQVAPATSTRVHNESPTRIHVETSTSSDQPRVSQHSPSGPSQQLPSHPMRGTVFSDFCQRRQEEDELLPTIECTNNKIGLTIN